MPSLTMASVWSGRTEVWYGATLVLHSLSVKSSDISGALPCCLSVCPYAWPMNAYERKSNTALEAFPTEATRAPHRRPLMAGTCPHLASGSWYLRPTNKTLFCFFPAHASLDPFLLFKSRKDGKSMSAVSNNPILILLPGPPRQSVWVALVSHIVVRVAPHPDPSFRVFCLSLFVFFFFASQFHTHDPMAWQKTPVQHTHTSRPPPKAIGRSLFVNGDQGRHTPARTGGDIRELGNWGPGKREVGCWRQGQPISHQRMRTKPFGCAASQPARFPTSQTNHICGLVPWSTQPIPPQKDFLICDCAKAYIRPCRNFFSGWRASYLVRLAGTESTIDLHHHPATPCS